jgi:hypothetical protein
MTETSSPRRKRTVMEVLGVLLCGMGLCSALAVVEVTYSQEQVSKEKQQVLAKMDEMKRFDGREDSRGADFGTPSRSRSGAREQDDSLAFHLAESVGVICRPDRRAVGQGADGCAA